MVIIPSGKGTIRSFLPLPAFILSNLRFESIALISGFIKSSNHQIIKLSNCQFHGFAISVTSHRSRARFFLLILPVCEDTFRRAYSIFPSQVALNNKASQHQKAQLKL